LCCYTPTLGVIGDLCDTGESRYFEQLREQTPEGLLEMLRVPGLGISKIQALHEGLGIATLQELENAAREGRLAKLKGFGPKTAEKILRGITYLRTTTAYVIYPHALIEARRLLAMVEQHPDVERAQKALKEMGHDPGPVDGVMGGNRPSAVERAA